MPSAPFVRDPRRDRRAVPDAFFGRPSRPIDEWSAHVPDRAARERTIGTDGRRMSIAEPDEPVAPPTDDEQSSLRAFLESDDDRSFDCGRDGAEQVPARSEADRDGERRRPCRAVVPGAPGTGGLEAHRLDVSSRIDEE